MAADTPAAGSVRSGVQSQAATVAPQFGLAATAGAKAQDAAGPVNGLGQQGQDAVKALAQQVAQDAAVKQGSFQQVTQALKDAPGAESGRLVISLKPAHLGDVTVDLVLSGGKINARLVASSPAVRDAFVQDLAGFKAGLEAHGVSVNEVSVALRAGVQDQQSQPQPQRQQDQAWWRGMADLKDPDLGRALGSAVYFGGESATDQRFSALA
jgi:flagellar hook-length control protein FliK